MPAPDVNERECSSCVVHCPKCGRGNGAAAESAEFRCGSCGATVYVTRTGKLEVPSSGEKQEKDELYPL